jgi:major membrane immunogen (membrane-anchored lipoprotein)
MKKIMMAVAVVATLGLAACGNEAKAEGFFSNFWGDSNNSARGEGNADGKAGAQGKFSINFEGKAMTEGNMDGKAGGVGNNSGSGNARGEDK